MSTLHAVDVTRLLQGLVGKKALLQEGQGRWSRYRLAEAVDSEHSHTLLAIAAPARNQKKLQPNEMERLRFNYIIRQRLVVIGRIRAAKQSYQT